MQRGNGDDRISKPQRGLPLVARLSPRRDDENGAPAAGIWIGVTIAVVIGARGKAVAPSLHLHDQQLLVLTGPLWVQPPSAQPQAKLAGS